MNPHHQHQHFKQPLAHLRDFNNGIYSLDSGYLRTELDAIHFMIDDGRVAVIDTSTANSVPRILEALGGLGLGTDQVDYIVLTHVHLDHAGGAGALLNHCPNARLTVHPRGVKHMVDPSVLWESVCSVYGEEMALREYGKLSPVDPDRILSTGEGAQITLGSRTLSFWDAPGHARHHVLIHDSQSNGVFTGDTFGISYRELDTPKGCFIFVTCPPTQFEPDPLRKSIRRVMDAKPSAVYLTHYSQVTDVAGCGARLLSQVDDYVALAMAHKDAGEGRAKRIQSDLMAMLKEQARSMGVGIEDSELEEVLALDVRLNADGLDYWLNRL